VQYVVSLLLAALCYFLITQLMFYNILSMFVLLLCIFDLYFVFYIVLCIVSPIVCSCLFPISVQISRPLPPGENPIAVNKYNLNHHHLRHQSLFVRTEFRGVKIF